ncbi:MAG: NAD(P)/FAD-dependent oxidoreductase [Betaproteobacteria bacterium]|nr:NAD(P)/FAD-dependent oxidoreductase [Betaproteobacteria bacterium]
MSIEFRYDAVIIGGGHNGLTCACYLSAAGLKVRILERHTEVGGAAVTEEFHPGFRNSTASYTVSLLHPKVIADLRLAEHGLRIVERPLSNFLPLPEKKYFQTGRTSAQTQAETARFSKRDAQRLPDYYRMLDQAADVVREMLLETPPNAGGGLDDFLSALKTAQRLRKLAMAERRNVLDFFTKSAGDVLDAWFESDPIKAAFGFDAIVGHFASPYTPGSAYVLLHHVIGEVNGQRGAWGHAIGGMGAITQAMRKEAEHRGVEITTGCEVAQVCADIRGVQGVQLADGRVIESRCVVSGVNPKLLYTKLMPHHVLDEDFLRRMRNYKCVSGTFRMNVALSELPDFTCMPGRQAGDHHKSGIIIAPSLHYMEQAYFDARTLGCSRKPVIEILIPSTVDDSLAPPGKHVASLFCQHFNPQLPNHLDWQVIREPVADLIIATVTQYAPNFKASVLGRMVLSPPDLEKRFGLVGGDIFHGALTLDQLWSARPLLGNGAYRGPVAGLYMCSAGTHPGGGVSGAPGHNAAREIVRDFKRGRARNKS